MPDANEPPTVPVPPREPSGDRALPDRSSLRSASAHVLVEPTVLDSGSLLVLDADTEHHLRRVLRLRDGESVGVTDGAGRWSLTRVTTVGSTLTLEPASDVVAEPAPSQQITIATAMPKGDRLEWLVQKVTELGVDRLVLLHAERSVVRWKADRVDRQRERLQRVADEALRQSRRIRRLVVEGPVDAADVLDGYVVAEPGGRKLLAGDVAVAIGPEGGWTDSELGRARDRVDLGPTILRTETAAVAMSALCVALER